MLVDFFFFFTNKHDARQESFVPLQPLCLEKKISPSNLLGVTNSVGTQMNYWECACVRNPEWLQRKDKHNYQGAEHKHCLERPQEGWRDCYTTTAGPIEARGENHQGWRWLTSCRLPHESHKSMTKKKKNVCSCSLLTEMKMFRRFSRVGSWGMSFCTTLLKASKMEWS